MTVFQKIGRTSQKLEQKLGRQPSTSALAKVLGMGERELHKCVQLAMNPVSLSTPTRQGDPDVYLENMLEDKDGEQPDKGSRERILKASVAKLIAGLEPREAEVLSLYYGQGKPSTLTLEEIAQRFDLTRERVRQIKVKAMERLKHPSREESLKRIRN